MGDYMFTCTTHTGLTIGAFELVPFGAINGRWQYVMNWLHSRRGDLMPPFNMSWGGRVT